MWTEGTVLSKADLCYANEDQQCDHSHIFFAKLTLMKYFNHNRLEQLSTYILTFIFSYFLYLVVGEQQAFFSRNTFSSGLMGCMYVICSHLCTVKLLLAVLLWEYCLP